MNRPPKFQLVDLKLDGDLATYLTDRRSAGDSLETIARRLWSLTGISVTSVTISNWLDLIAEPTEAAS